MGVVLETVLPFQFLNVAESSLGMRAGDALAQGLAPFCRGIVLGGNCPRAIRWAPALNARISQFCQSIDKKCKICQLSEV